MSALELAGLVYLGIGGVLWILTLGFACRRDLEIAILVAFPGPLVAVAWPLVVLGLVGYWLGGLRP